MTPSELFMDLLSREDVDIIQEAVVIYRKSDATIGYRVTGEQQFADTFGLLRFAQLSMENDLRKAWQDE